MISPSLFIRDTATKGRGVFTRHELPADTIIEVAPVIVLSPEDRKLLDQTRLHDYIFEWGEKDECCMALGYVPIYNHSNPSNCEYFMDYDDLTIFIKTVREIRAGEELTINYHGDFDRTGDLWFSESRDEENPQ